MNLRTKVSVVILVSATAAGSAFPALSGASPVDDKRRQAAQLQSQIESNEERTEAVAEKLKGARIRMTIAEEGINEAQRRTDAAEAEHRRIRSILSRRAAQIYRGAGSSSPLQQMDVKSLGELTTRSKYAAAAADRDDVLIAQLQKSKEALAVRKSELEVQRAAANAEADTATSARSELDKANRESRALLSQVNGEIADIIRQQVAQREAELAAAARRQAASPTRPSGGGGRTPIPPNFPNVPAPNAGAQAAVDFAKAQVGKAWRFATSGPNTFDCSGLTGAAWKQGGVSLTYYSGAQYQQTTRIGAGDLQPGDLIFYGPGGSNHVEIYIGNGAVVSASSLATGVKLSSVRYGSAIGYGRVHG